MAFNKVVKLFNPPAEELPVWMCPLCRGAILKCDCFKRFSGMTLKGMKEQARQQHHEEHGEL